MSTLLAADRLATDSGCVPVWDAGATVIEVLRAFPEVVLGGSDASLWMPGAIQWNPLARAGSSVVLRDAAVQWILPALYVWVRPGAIAEFLKHNPTVPMLLLEAIGEIERHFGRSQVSLNVTTDPDGDDAPQLVVRVHTALSPEEALRRLDAFDEAWWLDASQRGGDKVCITLAYQ